MPSRSHQPERATQAGISRRIVTTARRHFLTHGFRHITMDDLAEDLGMSKKTLYGCFPSKDALLKAVLIEKFRAVETDLHRITSDCSDVAAALHQLLACVQHHTEEIHPAFVRDIGREAPDLFKLVERRRRDVIRRHFGRLFDRGRNVGLIRKDIAPKMVIEILLGATQAIMNPPKMAELHLTPRSGYTTIITVILEGVLTRLRRPRRKTTRKSKRWTRR
jgi:AcrR family transcriptional regulator